MQATESISGEMQRSSVTWLPSALPGMLTGMILFGTTLFIPQLLQQVLGYSATDERLALTAGGVATILVMPIAGAMSGKVDARILIGVAFVIQALALL